MNRAQHNSLGLVVAEFTSVARTPEWDRLMVSLLVRSPGEGEDQRWNEANEIDVDGEAAPEGLKDKGNPDNKKPP